MDPKFKLLLVIGYIIDWNSFEVDTNFLATTEQNILERKRDNQFMEPT